MTRQGIAFKVVLVGNTQVGKTCIVDKLVTGTINNDVSPTIGASFLTFVIKRPQGPVRLHIWDTAGQEKFMSITSTYYRNANYALLCYDIADRNSFENLGRWLGDLKGNAPPDIKIILVGNKTDLEAHRQVSQEEAEKFQVDNDLIFYREVSALTGDGIRDLFVSIASLDAESAMEIIQAKKNEQGTGCC